MNPEGASISRAASRSQSAVPIPESGVSQQSSTMHEKVVLDDLQRPSDKSIERFDAWDKAVDQLSDYLGGVAKIHERTAKELQEVCEKITVPFKLPTKESHFLKLQEGGLQDIYSDIKAKTLVIAEEHKKLGATSILKDLEDLKGHIRQHFKNVVKQRELSTHLIDELSKGITSFQNEPMGMTSKTDPYILNETVPHQLDKEENVLQGSEQVEKGIVEGIKSVWQKYAQAQMDLAVSIASPHRRLKARMTSLETSREWLDHFLRPLRSSGHRGYPNDNHSSVAPLRIGLLERKGSSTDFRTGYFVLTQAGFLHEFKSSDDPGQSAPVFSLFLRLCTLNPPSNGKDAANQFSIEGREERGETTKSLRKDKHTIRMQSRSDMLGWYNAMKLCREASEELDHDEESRVADEEGRDDGEAQCEQQTKPLGPRDQDRDHSTTRRKRDVDPSAKYPDRAPPVPEKDNERGGITARFRNLLPNFMGQ
ncbi:hypothetical protein DFH06DRAFT_558481 [Mycena polygramma]|nr:hypothetical protein DFH06DRAFT_558481 [Mycena polygramma]